MPRVTAGRTRQYILELGTGIVEGVTPDTLQFFLEDGTPIDFTPATPPTVPWFNGPWDIGTGYSPANMVLHDDALWIATDGAEAGLEPGVDSEWTLMVQGVAP